MTRHLVIMAAGTGGHVMPGLAVAREMRSRGWTVSWLGTTHGMENQLVPGAGIAGLALDRIAFAGLRGKGLWGWLSGGWRLQKALWDCRAILRRRAADAVLGMGGYVCFPGGLMARACAKPLLLMNADVALQLANQWLLPVAARVAFGFDGAAARGIANAVVTGNPVRADIEALPAPARRFAGRQGPLRLLVVGGSLGAQVLNQTVPAALALLPAHERPRVTHQTGRAHHAAVQADYDARGIDATVRPFIDDMPAQLADCDLMLCRAGAITVSELCAAGVAALLVPLVVKTTRHQRDNAVYMAERDAALHLPQGEFGAQRLADALRTLTRERLLAMATHARALARPRAAARVADEIEALVTRPDAKPGSKSDFKSKGEGGAV
jgi:UDP-N-acetylglucosamine--N-acetylmuramyl-(pentapeptide) pyrophosphoryl-undecaprenol N-acetylglucosamine transferase